MIPAEFHQFRLSGRDYVHVEGGYCLRQIQEGAKLLWRVYYGPLRAGSVNPSTVSVFLVENEPVGTLHFDDAVAYIQGLR